MGKEKIVPRKKWLTTNIIDLMTERRELRNKKLGLKIYIKKTKTMITSKHTQLIDQIQKENSNIEQVNR